MTNEETVLNTFYKAFQELDHSTMASCYHKDACFSDEVFKLKGKEINAMWHMLCDRATDFNLHYSLISKENSLGVEWQADYTFSQTKRKVCNRISAEFEFKDGKIISHKDTFDFWKWSRQALGSPGILMGWSPLLRNKVSSVANNNLNRFIDKNVQYKN